MYERLINKLISRVMASTCYERYNTGDDATGYAYGNLFWYAQTFTVGNTSANLAHDITSVKLKLSRKGLPGTLTVSITDVDGEGKPTGSDLAVGTTNGDTVTTDSDGEWREIPLSSYVLMANTQYAIILKALSADTDNRVTWRCDNSSPTYTGGLGVWYHNGVWELQYDMDLMFEEYGDVLPEGKAYIVSVTAPDTFTPGVSFGIGVVVKNTGSFADMLFVRITDVDTGDVLGDQSIYVNAGATAYALSFILNLIQTTDFYGLAKAGHIE